MFDELRRYLNENGNFTEAEMLEIERLAIPKFFKKGQFILRAGEVCRYHTFIRVGCVKVYRLDESGREHIVKFGTEKWWVSDRESLLSGKPGESYIETLETEVLQWSNDNFEALFKSVPAFDDMFKILMSKALTAQSNRVYTSISSTAEEKYNDFVKKYPTLPSRVPLNMIAAFLGVTRETLTRIRRQSYNKVHS
jgi:CRP/FNR family transcriptional regulator